jgi:hypothetical protein
MMIVRRQHVWASASAELLKLRKRPAIWVLAGVWLALLTFFGYLLPYLGYLTGDSSAPRSGALAPCRRTWWATPSPATPCSAAPS